MKVFVTPTCCASAKQERAVVVTIDELKVGAQPHWALLLADAHKRYDEDDRWFCRQPPVPKCCPYCGTVLPAIEPRTGVTVPIWRGDADYCGTCFERNMNCRCVPPWAMFQPAGGDGLDVDALWRVQDAAWRTQYGDE